MPPPTPPCLLPLPLFSADERQVTDADYRSFLEAVIGRLGEAEQHAGGLLQELAAAAAARVAAPTGGSGGAGAWAAAGAIMVVPDGGSVAQPLPGVLPEWGCWWPYCSVPLA